MRTLMMSQASRAPTLLELTNLAADLFQGLETLLRLVDQMRRFYQLIAIGT